MAKGSEEDFDGTNALDLLSGSQKRYLLSHGSDDDKSDPKKYEEDKEFDDGFTIIGK